MTQPEPIRSHLRTSLELPDRRCSVFLRTFPCNYVNSWKAHLPEKEVNTEDSSAGRWKERNQVLVTSFKERDSMVPEARAISLDCSIT